MNLIMLVEPNHRPIPSDITVVQDFGRESIIGDDGDLLAVGDAVYMQGDTGNFAKWLKQFDGVWTTNNPMAGKWNVVHVKEITT